MTTIKLKNGSGAPTAGDLAQGEPALDLTNKRLYTEDSGGTVIEVGTNPGVDVTFADNRKAIFGAGSDLQLYHSGSHSYIIDNGTGDLKIYGANIEIGNASGVKNLFATSGGATTLYFNNSAKLATTATGIDVTGTVTADGLTVDGTGDALISNGELQVSAGSGDQYTTRLSTAYFGTTVRSFIDSFAGTAYDGALYFRTNNNAGGMTNRMLIEDSGDISFYEDTGTTAKFSWSSANETIAIGTGASSTATISAYSRTVSASLPSALRIIENTGASAYWDIGSNNGSSPNLNFYVNANTTPKVTFASSGNVGIGTSSPTNPLTVVGTGASTLTASKGAVVDYQSSSVSNIVPIGFSWSSSTSNQNPYWGMAFIPTNYSSAIGELGFYTGNTERMRIDSNGHVGLGHTDFTNYSGKLVVADGSVGGSSFIDIHNNNNNQFVKIGINNNTALIAYDNADEIAFGQMADASGTSLATEHMRIDSSGNLLVSKSSLDVGTAGLELRADGLLAATRSGSNVGVFRRLSDDGSIVDFQKDGTTVGQINARSGDLVIGTGTTGLQFYDVGNAIFPLSASGNTNRDAAIDLGEGSNRFKDFYLSGRVVADGVTTSAHAWSSQSDSTSSSAHLYFRNPNGFVGNISTSGTATAYNTSSDYRLKENVVAMSGATERLKQLAPKRFNFIADADTTVDGFLAHEVADVVPEAVTGAKDAVDDDGNAVYQGIDQSKLVPLLVATIQELEARIAALESN